MADMKNRVTKIIFLSQELDNILSSFDSSDALITCLILKNVARDVLHRVDSVYVDVYIALCEFVLEGSILADDACLLACLQSRLSIIQKYL